ncbi:hypothetical protein [Planomonospora sp. ID82291]|uniref:hypothetical protein n=1 Tax=Planomonospora sp. ID82291 TaxID=2738136 RepID=UPI0018C43C21|nr:hypothetical protein [Planomonospora sp. ID82291]MBG0819142.1 hypothetical protein [Planomonospora sp. ID82291]
MKSHEEINYDETKTLNSSTQDLSVLEIPPAGFLRGVYVLVEATSSSNVATVAFATNDAPFNVIDSITLEDTNSKPIVGPFSGYDLYLINKYGGYTFSSDPKQSPIYTATTGTTTPATFNFCLRIPVELVSRDALGSLPNKSGTNKFKVRVRLSAIATIYSTPPTNAPSVRVRMVQEDWWEPDASDLKGRPLAQNPPAMQTTQYWTKGTYSVNSGDQRIQIQQGLGYLIRNLLFINYTTGSLRNSTSDGNWPDPATLQFESTILFDRLRTLWRDRIARDYGYVASVETAGGYDYSVYPLPFTLDMGLKPGAESRRGYLATADASRLEFRGNFGAASNFVVLANYVAPARGDDAMITI